MEAQLSEDLYLRFRDLLLTRSGLYYPERKRADLQHGLTMAMEAAGHASLSHLYAAVCGGGTAWDDLLAQLTIGETYFFRNAPQFDALREHIIPDLLHRRAATHTLRVWSAGCATGEEPYSLAMTFGDMLPHPGWSLSILATDINPHYLARAHEALYGEWSFRETPPELRARFWVPEQSRWRLRPEIRRMVSFARLNLAEPSYPTIINGTTAIDLLVCRNVTIYFDEATTRRVVDRFFQALAPGGWLIVGHSEPQASVYHQFEVHNFPNTVIYRKPLDAQPFASESPRASNLELDRKPHQRDRRLAGESGAPHLKVADRPARFRSGRTGPLAPLEPLGTNQAGDVAMMLREAQRYADRGAWAEAERSCQQVLERDPVAIEAHYLMAQIYEHRGELEAALSTYRRTVYLDRGYVNGLLGMGNVWRQLGRTSEARRYYQNALQCLAQLAPTARVPGAGGATALELAALIEQHLRAVR